MQNRDKRQYVRPSMTVVKLRMESQLLAGSGGLGSAFGYDGGGDPFSDDE